MALRTEAPADQRHRRKGLLIPSCLAAMSFAKRSSELPRCGPHAQLVTAAALSEEEWGVFRIVSMMLSCLARYHPEARGARQVPGGRRLVWAAAFELHNV